MNLLRDKFTVMKKSPQYRILLQKVQSKQIDPTSASKLFESKFKIKNN